MSRTMSKDAELKEKVESELEFEPRIDAAHVGVFQVEAKLATEEDEPDG